MSEIETIADEIFAERSAIAEFDGLLTRDHAEAMGKLASDEYRQACEVRYVIGLPFADRRPFLDGVEKNRGKPHADKLRSAVQAEWMRRKKEGKVR